MKQWSKTKKIAESLFDQNLKLQIHLTTIRSRSEIGTACTFRVENRDTKNALFFLPQGPLLSSQLLSATEVTNELWKWIESEPDAFWQSLQQDENSPRRDLWLLRMFLSVVDRRVGKRRLRERIEQLPDELRSILNQRL